MSMSDDDLNALLAAWAQEDGTGGNEIGGEELSLATMTDESDTFAALISAAGGGGGNSNWPDNGQKGGGKREYGKSKAQSPQRIAGGESIYYGRVKTYDKEKNRGYIACDEIGSSCGMDVYVFGDVLASAGAAPGDAVAFFVFWSKQGHPQAQAPMFRLGAAAESGGYALRGEFKPGSGAGSGFIVCEHVKEFFGRDTYCPKEMAAVLQAGQSVGFNAVLNAQTKYPAVDGLEPCEPDWEPTIGDLSNSRTDPTVQSKLVKGADKGSWSPKGATKGAGKGKGEDTWGGGKGKGEEAWGDSGGKGKGKGEGKGGKMELMMKVMELLVGDDWGDDSWSGGDDSWGGGKGAAADDNKPAWLVAAKQLSGGGGGASAGGWNSGGWNSGSKGGWDSGSKGGWKDSGKSSAKGEGKSFEGGGVPTPSGETFYGVIKTFNQKNNYGFIASEQVQEKYNGVDCFFHGKFYEGHSVGDMVEFDVGLNAKGQPQAMAIRAFTLPEEPDPKKLKLM